jgi:hypothetical protein
MAGRPAFIEILSQMGVGRWLLNRIGRGSETFARGGGEIVTDVPKALKEVKDVRHVDAPLPAASAPASPPPLPATPPPTRSTSLPVLEGNLPNGMRYTTDPAASAASRAATPAMHTSGEVGGTMYSATGATRFGPAPAGHSLNLPKVEAPAVVEATKKVGWWRDANSKPFLPGQRLNATPLGSNSRDFTLINTPQSTMRVDVRGTSAPSLGQVVPHRDPGFQLLGRDLATVGGPAAAAAGASRVVGLSPLGRVVAGLTGATAVVGTGYMLSGSSPTAPATAAPPAGAPSREPAEPAAPEFAPGSGLQAYAQNHSKAYAKAHRRNPDAGVPTGVANNFNRSTQIAENMLSKLAGGDQVPLNEAEKYAAATLGPQRMLNLEVLRAAKVKQEDGSEVSLGDVKLSQLGATLRDRTERQKLFASSDGLEARLTAVAKASGSMHMNRDGTPKWDRIAAQVENTRFSGKLQSGADVTPQSLISAAQDVPTRVATAPAAAPAAAAPPAGAPAARPPAARAPTAPAG